MKGYYPIVFSKTNEPRVINKKYTQGRFGGSTAALNRANRECKGDETYSAVDAETYEEAVIKAKEFPR